jgi:hypothetical protein
MFYRHNCKYGGRMQMGGFSGPQLQSNNSNDWNQYSSDIDPVRPQINNPIATKSYTLTGLESALDSPLQQDQKPRLNPWRNFHTLRAGTLLATELAGRQDRTRQDQYYYNQLSTIGQMNPMPYEEFQPNPYNLYARMGGNLKHYRRGGSSNNGSIVDFLNSQKEDSSFNSRALFWKEGNHQGQYKGTSEQNLMLLRELSAASPDRDVIRTNVPNDTTNVSRPPVATKKTAMTSKPDVTDIFENDRQRFFAKKAAIANNGRFVMTDTNNHQTYYGTYDPKTDKFDVNKFEVLTGKNNKELDYTKTKSIDLDDVDKLSQAQQDAYKVTPVGFFDLKKDKDYGYNSLRLMGDNQYTGIAYHKTYEGADDMTRAARYNNNNNNDNNVSYGCINCQKPSIDALTNFVGDKPLKGLVINSSQYYAENAKAMKKNNPSGYNQLNLGFKKGGKFKYRGNK